jgi:hypothetical protein
LTDRNRQTLTPEFFASFFPVLSNGFGDLHVRPQSTKNNDDSRAKVNFQLLPTNLSDDVLNEETDGTSILPSMDIVSEVHEPGLEDIRWEDTKFKERFIDNQSEYSSIEEVYRAIDDYQADSGFRIVIRFSAGLARTYFCASHAKCCFRAKFGPQRGTDKIVLKGFSTIPFHCGATTITSADGRATKGRFKGRVETAVDQVMLVKDGAPIPKDVMKAAANLNNFSLNYQQAYRAVNGSRKDMIHKQNISFQLIGPYLRKFVQLNPGSKAISETDAENKMVRLFVCPGIMDTYLRYVRPVVSLDAMHLKSVWKGTLYIASTKTACDEIYPVAFAIARGNENRIGWKWFLEQLGSSIRTLNMDHPKPGITKKYFTFISDRQKGLTEALAKVFPENHSCSCAIHIARNC